MELPSGSDGPNGKQTVTEHGFELRSVSDQSPQILTTVVHWAGWTVMHMCTQLSRQGCPP